MRRKSLTLGGILLAGVLSAVSAGVVAQQHDEHEMRHGANRGVQGKTSSGISVEDLPLADGAFQRVWYAPPSGVPKGTIVMFPGGAGTIGIEKNGDIKHQDNFLVRTRESWTQRGYGIVLIDAIGHETLRGQRSTAAYAEVTRQIVHFAREQSRLPVWLMGTSQGSIGAMNAATHQTRESIAGLILTESVSIRGGSHETVFDAHPQDVTVPALVVANEDDQCIVAPPSEADPIAHSMTRASITVLRVKGGTMHSGKACGSLSPHGYYGIENQVIDDITGWMATGHLTPRG